MAKKHINAGNANIPDYQTLKEIIVTGAQKGQDKRQFVFLDKNKSYGVLDITIFVDDFI